jgi:hypothetical protein
MGNAACCATQTNQTMDFEDMGSASKNKNFGYVKGRNGLLPVLKFEVLEADY